MLEDCLPLPESPSIKRISASGLALYLRCGEAYSRRYCSGPRAESPMSEAAAAGIGFHAAMSEAIRLGLAGQPIELDACLSVGVGEVARRYGLVGLDIDPMRATTLEPAEVLDGVLSRVKRCAEWFLTTQLERLRPATTERKFEVAIPGTDWLLHGVIDMEEDDGTVVDFKLKGKAPNPDAGDRSLQLSVYALAKLLETGKLPPALRLDCIIDGKRMGGMLRETVRTQADADRTLNLLQRVCKMIDAGHFAPADPEAWNCSAAYCQYWRTCPFGGLGLDVGPGAGILEAEERDV